MLRLIDEETRVSIDNPVDKVLAERDSGDLARPAILIREDGREVAVSDTTTTIRDDSGAVRGVIVVIRNVTAERRERLREAFLADATGMLSATFDYEARARAGRWSSRCRASPTLRDRSVRVE